MTTDLFTALIIHTQAVADHHGEQHIACPECGHLSTPKSPHCSFSEHGWYCFVCASHGSLADLARRVHLDAGPYAPPKPAPKQKDQRPPSWMSDPERYVYAYERHPKRFELWQAHKGVSAETIRRTRLGVGRLPACSCSHERLVVPVISGTMIVGLRGRALGCNCAKWINAAGTTLDLLPLYNQAALRPGAVIFLVENCVDALLIGERTPYTGLATYSTSYWREAWTETLVTAHPELIVVAYDNDLPGNGGALRRQEFILDWLRTHPRIPEPTGPKMANRLLKAGLPATLFDWGRAQNKADVGSLLCGTRTPSCAL